MPFLFPLKKKRREGSRERERERSGSSECARPTINAHIPKTDIITRHKADRLGCTCIPVSFEFESSCSLAPLHPFAFLGNHSRLAEVLPVMLQHLSF